MKGYITKEQLSDSLKNELSNFELQLDVNVTCFNSLQECHDYCLENNKNMFIPSGVYEINEPLVVKGVSIRGENSRNTIIKLNDCDGFILEEYDSNKVVELSNLTFISVSANRYDHYGIRFKEETDRRAIGYKLRNLYFEELGCAISLTDCFRTGLSHININNCFRSLIIQGQVVQLSAFDVISNCDLSDSASSSIFNDKIGIEIKGDNHSGVYQRPESLKFNQVCMVHNDINLRIHDGLYLDFHQCDLDLSRKECVRIYSYDSLNISNSWISTKSETEEPIVRIETSTHEFKKMSILNNTISVLMGGHPNKIGVSLGLTADHYFKKGVNISNNIIQSLTPIKLKYGIYASRPRQLSITNNHIQECTDKDIHIEFIEGGDIISNVCDNIYVLSNSPIPYKISNNIGNVITDGTTVTIKDFTGMPSKIIKESAQNIESQHHVDITHNLNKNISELDIKIFQAVDLDGTYKISNSVSFKQIDKNTIRFTNNDTVTLGVYVIITD